MSKQAVPSGFVPIKCPSTPINSRRIRETVPKVVDLVAAASLCPIGLASEL
jgi:hypothetical protein